MINMIGHIGSIFTTHTAVCTNYSVGDYNNDGEWVEGTSDTFTAPVNLQPINQDDVKFLTGQGGTVDIQRTFNLHLNTGDQVYAERQTKMGVIQASTVQIEYQGETRTFEVKTNDNRPWHNFCQAYIEMRLP